jgi:hypothetical protein
MQNRIIQIQNQHQLPLLSQLAQKLPLKILGHFLTEPNLITPLQTAFSRNLLELLLVSFLAAGGTETVEDYWVGAFGEKEKQFGREEGGQRGTETGDFARERTEERMFGLGGKERKKLWFRWNRIIDYLGGLRFLDVLLI